MSTSDNVTLIPPKKQPATYIYIVVIWSYGYATVDNAYTDVKVAKQRLFDLYLASPEKTDGYVWQHKMRHRHAVRELRETFDNNQKQPLFGYVERLPLIGGAHD